MLTACRALRISYDASLDLPLDFVLLAVHAYLVAEGTPTEWCMTSAEERTRSRSALQSILES